MKVPKSYTDQLDIMLLNARLWRKANPDKKVLVQFNFPEKVAVVAAIDDAIRRKFVVTNRAGLELVKALWPWDVPTIPTVLMVRVVLEHE